MRTIVVLAAILWAGRGLAQTVPNGDAAIPVFRESAQLVMVDVLAEDRKTGEPVTSLTKDDFEVREDGAAQKIRYFSQDKLPLSVVFVFDLTDTVRPVLFRLSLGALKVLNELRPQDEAAVMVFYSTTEMVQDFTHDHALLAAAISRASDLRSKEASFVNEAVYQAAEASRRATIADSRRVLVFLSDGTANNPDEATKRKYGQSAPERLHTEKEAETEVAQTEVVVSAIIERSAMSRVADGGRYENPVAAAMARNSEPGEPAGDLRRYAAETGGAVLATSALDVAARTAELIDRLRNRYTLGYAPSGAESKPGGKPRFRKIEVRLNGGAHGSRAGGEAVAARDVVLRAKRGYYR